MVDEPSPLHYKRFPFLRPLWPFFHFLSKSRTKVILTLSMAILGLMTYLAVDAFTGGRKIEQRQLVLGGMFAMGLVLVIFIGIFGRVALKKGRLKAIKER